MTLAGIRHELEKTQGSISRTLYTILHSAQKDGIVDKDAAPTMRDGRLVIPVAPQVKRRINGIVHDESATGKTVFIDLRRWWRPTTKCASWRLRSAAR